MYSFLLQHDEDGSSLLVVATVVVALYIASPASALGSVAKSVNVSVRAKWEGTSLLLEAGLDFCL
jgi:hypothetical protein